MELSTDIGHRNRIQAKMRTHSRQKASYIKQVDKYWLLIEDSGDYEGLREQFYELTESVEEAELDLEELIEDKTV